MTSRRELALLRLVAQGLAGPRAPTPLEAVRRLGAMQAQDLPGVLTSVALRTEGGTRTEVEAALTDGALVRSWPMRGTLHLLPAADLCWILPLAAPRMIAAAATRRAQLGIDDAVLARARDVAVAATSGARGLRRAELMTLWSQAGLLAEPQSGYHLLAHLCQEGLLALGPLDGGAQLIVAVADWVRRPEVLEREEALARWALRYFRGHGPATVKDFARWASLTLKDVRAGVAAAGDQLTTMLVDGTEHLLDPRTPELLAEHRSAARALILLPGFDEFMLGYADRSAALAPEHAERIVPGGNGIFRPTVVQGGQVVGTWRRVGGEAGQTVDAVPFAAFTAIAQARIRRAFAALP